MARQNFVLQRAKWNHRTEDTGGTEDTEVFWDSIGASVERPRRSLHSKLGVGRGASHGGHGGLGS
jgi:hypothetical protein